MGSSPVHFDILDPESKIDTHALLEASAGTGKTFSIEHLFARLILSGIRVEEILALTFTKKAAKELKERIQLNLRALLKSLNEEGELPRYVERGEKAKEKIQLALFEFDFCTISTIHSFAERLLREFSDEPPRELVTLEEVQEVVKTFLRFGVNESILSAEEVDHFLKEFHGKAEGAIDHLAREIQRKEKIVGEDPFAKIASLCQLYFRKWKERHKKFSHDDTLLRLKEQLSSREFVERERRRTRVVIVDEFQDTDKLQWEIFDELYLKDPLKRSRLFLVGDPKQSIYAFRGADIYTYLEAAKRAERRLSLMVNWRSSPSLVHALNRFFGEREIALPRNQSEIPIPKVAAGKSEEENFRDGKRALHTLFIKGNKRGKYFPNAEHEEKLLSYFVSDLIALQIPFEKSAILVRDRGQGERMKALLERWGVAASMKREEKLSETDAYFFAKQLFQAMDAPENLKGIKAVLASPLLSLPLQKIASLEIEELAEAAEVFAKTRSLLQEEGIFSALSLLFKASFFGHRMEIEIQKSGLLFSFMQIIEEVASSGFEKIEEKPLRFEESESAIQILTIHASKGLEFDVVFPIGILSRSFQKERWALIADRLVSRAAKEVEEELPLLDAELVSEKHRLLYVAMTRAKKRLYLPIAFPENEKKVPEERERSLIESFAGKVAPFVDWLKGEEAFSFEEVTELKVIRLEKREETLAPPPLPQMQREFSSTPIVSFTQLAKGGRGSISSPPEGAFPHGGEAGRLLHLLFEKIRWGETDLSLIREEITPLLRGTVLEPWIGEAAQMVQNAFLAPLPGFSLKDVDEGSTLREVQFLYKEEARLVKGVIDLIFSYQGEFYLLDWKSNWLGSEKSDYSKEAMALAMEREEYTLQSSLYKEALTRYLKQLGFKKPPSRCYYLFLRGLDPASSELTGVFSL